MNRTLTVVCTFGIVFAIPMFVGCEPEKKPQSTAKADASAETKANAPAETKGESKQPTRIMVQHCLIGFQGSVPGPTRSKEEAKELAESLMQKLKDGANFDEIIKEYTNDSPPGIYKMVNFGISADSASGTYKRDGMVPAFGNVGFDLKVDEYGMAEYHPTNSPFGWHIIKRLE